jgi:hypothetical protein
MAHLEVVIKMMPEHKEKLDIECKPLGLTYDTLINPNSIYKDGTMVQIYKDGKPFFQFTHAFLCVASQQSIHYLFKKHINAEYGRQIREKTEAAVNFYKDAFCVDGEVRLILPEEFKNFEIVAVVELNDSKRGKFYIARVLRN